MIIPLSNSVLIVLTPHKYAYKQDIFAVDGWQTELEDTDNVNTHQLSINLCSRILTINGEIKGARVTSHPLLFVCFLHQDRRS